MPPVATFEEQVAELVNQERADCTLAACPLSPLKLVSVLGALAGLLAGFALWSWTLLLPSIAKSGWLAIGFLTDGPFGIALLRPEQLLGLSGLDSLTHALLWSLLANAGLYVAVSLARAPSAREATQALLSYWVCKGPRPSDT